MSMLLNGVSGLNAANNALNVVGQNVANAAVKGYSRQTVYLETASGGLNGVKVTKVDRIVNDFLNDDIWRTGSDVGYYDGFQSYLGYLEQILGTESLNLNDAVADISAAINAAMSAPDSNAYRQQVLSSAEALVQDLFSILTLLVLALNWNMLAGFAGLVLVGAGTLTLLIAGAAHLSRRHWSPRAAWVLFAVQLAFGTTLLGLGNANSTIVSLYGGATTLDSGLSTAYKDVSLPTRTCTCWEGRSRR